jgi:hypothetical protein
MVVGLVLDQRVFQHAFEGLARDVARCKGALKSLWGGAAQRSDSGRLQRLAVEQSPGHRVGASPSDPFLTKMASPPATSLRSERILDR